MVGHGGREPLLDGSGVGVECKCPPSPFSYFFVPNKEFLCLRILKGRILNAAALGAPAHRQILSCVGCARWQCNCSTFDHQGWVHSV